MSVAPRDRLRQPRPRPAVAATRRLHMIGNAHLDVAWLWTGWEGLHEVRAPFRSALDRMAEFEDFHFSASSASYYEWIERTDPLMFAEIRRRVEEGRWHLVGGWWVEPDCNVPGGESLVRQGLYGQRYFHDRFGRLAEAGYNVDSFGHPATLPQILKKSRLARYVFMRPQPHEQSLPSRLFWWEGTDGSRVLAFRVPFEYGASGDGLEKHVGRCLDELSPSLKESMCFYGVGNHGGGPTIGNTQAIGRLRRSRPDVEIAFSSPAAFFARAEEWEHPIPLHAGGLQHHARGCYAAHSGIKRWNRKAEQLLLTAEKFGALAQRVSGLPYPRELAQAWKSVLFKQFHDVLAGTSVPAAYGDARNAYGEACAIAGRALHAALQSISWQIRIDRTGDDLLPVVVFNPHAWRVRAAVEIESDLLQTATHAVDEGGRAHPLQTIAPAAAVGWRRRAVFDADLPPLGYRVFKLRATHARPDLPAPAPNGAQTTLENESPRGTLDTRSRLPGLLEVEVQVDWREARRTLKLRWPLLLAGPRATYEAPYGFVERSPNGDEEPGQAWIDCSGRHARTGLPYGISLLNDGKFSFDVDGADLGLTVLRSPAYAHHDPHRPEPWETLAYLDQGEQTFSYALLPHAERWTASTVRRAAELNQRPLVLLDTWHPGRLPAAGSLVAAEPENVVVSVIKCAEDDPRACVVRCYETAGAPADAVIAMPALGRLIRAQLAPGEIKTFLVPEDSDRPVEETDLLEWR